MKVYLMARISVSGQRSPIQSNTVEAVLHSSPHQEGSFFGALAKTVSSSKRVLKSLRKRRPICEVVHSITVTFTLYFEKMVNHKTFREKECFSCDQSYNL